MPYLVTWLELGPDAVLLFRAMDLEYVWVKKKKEKYSAVSASLAWL